ncbi:hypothetical protein H4R34_004029 [Dimargaris verticillata]|uniref:Solute carrier family 25 member 38 homolog n=1 Tax=Dimargaris verticillata TaxID=2761393 RepID=A0A9W8E7M8_9FUNG|nr:hypothetical protein H4R34_004029 [Dimargaris verticillata]
MSATNVRDIPPTAHFLAGGAAGLTSCLIVQPFDLVKTRLQQNQTPKLSSALARPHLDKRNMPGSAAYFATLNQFKQVLASVEQYFDIHPGSRTLAAASHDRSKPQGTHKVVLSNTGNLIAGSSARALIGLALMPITVIKVRYESNLYTYRSILDACRGIMAKDKFRGFFTGYIPTMLRDAPYAGLYIAFYEQFKLQIPDLLRKSMGVQLPVPVTGIGAGLLAGVTATLLTQPFDMVKTRMQLKPETYQTAWQSARLIVKNDGPLGFFRGAALRVARKAVSTSISWTIYEELIRWDLQRITQSAGFG